MQIVVWMLLCHRLHRTGTATYTPSSGMSSCCLACTVMASIQICGVLTQVRMREGWVEKFSLWPYFTNLSITRDSAIRWSQVSAVQRNWQKNPITPKWLLNIKWCPKSILHTNSKPILSLKCVHKMQYTQIIQNMYQICPFSSVDGSYSPTMQCRKEMRGWEKKLNRLHCGWW